MVLCIFCNSELSSEASLRHHQKKAKFCLSKQNLETITEYKCEFCDNSYTTNRRLKAHQESCLPYNLNKVHIEYKKLIDEQEKTILEQKNQIKELQDKLENVAIHAVSRPTTSTIKNTQINYIQQMKPVIDDELKDNAQNLTIDHILKGPEGYAQYALDYPLKDRVCCVDYARRKVKFKDPNGNVITDPEMSTLATKFFQSIKDKNKDLIIEYGTKLNEHLGEHLQDLIDILDIKSGVDNGADGSKTEFYHDFVKNICGKTIVE